MYVLFIEGFVYINRFIINVFDCLVLCSVMFVFLIKCVFLSCFFFVSLLNRFIIFLMLMYW